MTNRNQRPEHKKYGHDQKSTAKGPKDQDSASNAPNQALQARSAVLPAYSNTTSTTGAEK